jgi:hypothetical protein
VKGKPLSALLQILRSAGVTRYATPELTLELGPAPPPKRAVATAINLSPEALDAERRADEDDEKEPEDFRFGLESERRAQKWFPRPRANPKRNGVAS